MNASQPWLAKFKVEDLMSRDLQCLSLSDQLRLWDQSASWRRFRHLPVTDEAGKLLGLVSHRDVMNRVASAVLNPQKRESLEKFQAIPVHEVMLKNVETINPHTGLIEAAHKMFENQMGALPVIDDEGTLLGILTEADFVELVHFGEDTFKD
ncbi:MAG: hypothetical protein COV44_11710 [Deltaproteobacteria bacterium CG11_big_fil_rev_8_21_14_0_20_45_16]|nr:MAG: hypothetical protein COV44_11710 [Deltaproteobacteria bacterium CG11_big_fil_rev_8_21_14_0_20_45_16]